MRWQADLFVAGSFCFLSRKLIRGFQNKFQEPSAVAGSEIYFEIPGFLSRKKQKLSCFFYACMIT